MTESMPLRSLADDLRARSAEQIGDLLRARPDLTHPWPTDLSQLARRAGEDASVLEAMQTLDTTALRVLEVYAALQDADVAHVAAGLPEPAEQVHDAVAHLWSIGLLWCRSRPRIVRAAQQAFGPHPCGLAATGHAAADPDAVRLAAVDFDADDLNDLVWRNPVRDSEHPLLTARSGAHVLSRESALILREGMFLLPAAQEPVVTQATPSPADLMWAPIAGVRYLLTVLADVPMPWHEGRGVSRRVLADRAQTMRVPVDDLIVWLELAAAAELLGAADGGLRPSRAADGWLRDRPRQMWLTLIEAWLDAERLLSRCHPEEAGCVSPARMPRASLHRRHVLQIWPARSRLDARQLTDVVSWYRPRMHEAVQQAAAVFAEAEALGLSQAGVATAAAELLPGDIQAAADLLPAAQTGPCLIVQPDHTVIAPANVDASVWSLLSEIAVVESWGPVTMHRIEPHRLRGAVTGRRAEDILHSIRQASRTPLPQSLEYLVLDAARGSSAHVYRATVIEVAAVDVDVVVGLGFARVGEQVFISDQPQEVVQQRLAAAGIAVDATDSPMLGQPMDYPRAAPLSDDRALSRLVAFLVAGTQPAHVDPPELQPADPQTVSDVCQKAIADNTRLWVQYSDATGTVTELVEPIQVTSGRLTGWSLTNNRTVMVPLARIASYAGQ